MVGALTALEDHLGVDVRSFDEMEKLGEFWQSIQCYPESDFDFCQMILKSRPEILRPHVLVVYQDDMPISLVAPGRPAGSAPRGPRAPPTRSA